MNYQLFLKLMTLDSLIKKYQGRYLDYDGAYGAQCVDLMRAYVKEVLGHPPYLAIPTTGNAKNIYYNFKNNLFFTKIANTPTGVPKKGDIIFFKTSLWYPWLYGIAGHVAIFTGGDTMNVISFDQNWPTYTPCHLQRHTYKDCLGWLSPRK